MKTRVEILNLLKGNIKVHTCQVLNVSPLKLVTRQECLLLPLLFKNIYFYLGFLGGSDGKESAFLFTWLFWVLVAPHVI